MGIYKGHMDVYINLNEVADVLGDDVLGEDSILVTNIKP